MAASHEPRAPAGAAPGLDHDAVIVGAGMSGMDQLHRLRELGMRARVFEAGSGVGGTWYWNRYPGARFDSESYSYGYSFSHEPLEEWDWPEHFAAQPETLRCLDASRDSSQRVPNAVAPRLPWLIGGAADLAPSTKTSLTFAGAGDFEPGEHGGRNLHFGIREHAVGSAANGLALAGLRDKSGFTPDRVAEEGRRQAAARTRAARGGASA